MCDGYHIWSKELLMQAKNDGALHGGQRSSKVKFGKYVLKLAWGFLMGGLRVSPSWRKFGQSFPSGTCQTCPPT